MMPRIPNAGAQLRMTTPDSEALAAIHGFLRFQIHDHRTGDPPDVQKQDDDFLTIGLSRQLRSEM